MTTGPKTRPAPAAPPLSAKERPTWLSLLLGSAIWFLHLNLVYGLASLACKWDWFPFTFAGLPALLVFEALITLVALLLMLVVIYLPWRDWRRYQSGPPADNPRLLHDTEKDRRPLVAFITMLLNSLLFLFVITTLVPVFSLNPCA
jgi:hypothetical protein